jgi:hypothetical protein
VRPGPAGSGTGQMPWLQQSKRIRGAGPGEGPMQEVNGRQAVIGNPGQPEKRPQETFPEETAGSGMARGQTRMDDARSRKGNPGGPTETKSESFWKGAPQGIR